MPSTIKAMIDNGFNIAITKRHFQDVMHYCIHFETRDQHAMALNSPYLGLYPIFYTTQDMDHFFNIFDTTDKEFKRTLVSGGFDSLLAGISRGELRKLIVKLDAVDDSRKVQSDPFNIFMTYIIHKVAVCSTLNANEKEQMTMALMKIFQYKFFTSLVNYRFKYGADDGAMKATVDRLSNKFAITKLGTWKKVLESRATELLSKTSIHYNTVHNYDDDIKIMYFITDVQTRIRNQINIVTTAYYLNKEKNDEIGSYGISGNDLDGEKVVLNQVSVFDSMSSNLTNEIMSVHQFITPELIELMCKMHTNIRYDIFKSVLVKFSEHALTQSKSKKPEMGLDLIKVVNNQEQYIGARILIMKIIQKTYRYCIQSNINIKSKIDILKATKDVYSSSRISDPNILAVRDSVALFIDTCRVSRRPATVTSLKIAFITYVITKSFKYL